MKRRHLSKKEVEHIAWLAHIELSQKEKERFTRQFNEILEFFRKIDGITFTEEIQPTYHVLDLINIYREDVPTPSMRVAETLANASKKEKGFIKAPRIV